MIEVQFPSYNAIKKEYTSDIFLRVYINAFKDGLVSSLKPTNFTVFLTICSFMDAKGECYPTQRQIAERCGLSKTTVNKAVNELLEFEIAGQKIINRSLVGQNGNSVYTVLPISQVAIFDAEIQKVPEVKEAAEDPGEFKNGNDVLKFYESVFREVYGVTPKINWRIESSMIKKAWIGKYTDQQIRTMIETAVKEYDNRWKNASYPRPSIRGLVSWLGDAALAIHGDQEKEFQEIQELTGNEDEIENAAWERMQNALKKG